MSEEPTPIDATTLLLQIDDIMQELSSKEVQTNKDRDDFIEHLYEITVLLIKEVLYLSDTIKRIDKFVGDIKVKLMDMEGSQKEVETAQKREPEGYI